METFNRPNKAGLNEILKPLVLRKKRLENELFIEKVYHKCTLSTREKLKKVDYEIFIIKEDFHNRHPFFN